jgi:hypothetical protein
MGLDSLGIRSPLKAGKIRQMLQHTGDWPYDMRVETLWSIEAPNGQGKLLAFEPTEAEVQVAAPMLAIFKCQGSSLTNGGSSYPAPLGLV